MSKTMVYPHKCPGCGVLTEENGFSRDRYQPSGRKSRCKACCNRAAETYHHAVRKPRREAVLEAERRAEEKIRERAHRERLKAVRKEAEEGRKRQEKLFREIAEEVAERARLRTARATNSQE